LVGNDLANAKKVAILVEKVKRAETSTKKEEALFTELSLEKTDDTLAFKVVNRRSNRKYRVDDAISRLKF